MPKRPAGKAADTDTSPPTDLEVERWARRRLQDERESIPEPGERVLFRAVQFGDVGPALVDLVQDTEEPGDHWGSTRIPDVNVWRVNEHGRHVLTDDPWPWVRVSPVQIADDGSEVLTPPRWCKEARVRGSAGWLRAGSRAHTGDYEK